MKKSQERIGCFTKTPCCVECSYFQPPPTSGMMIYMQRLCCPKCGGEIKIKTGKFRFVVQKHGWFGLCGETTKFLEFIRKVKDES